MRYKGERARGLIETIGMVPALLAADAMHLPQCQSPLLRHAHTLWTNPFVRNRYAHEPQSAEWSVFGQRASSQLGFCRTACPKTLRSWIMGWRVEHLRTRLDALAHACSCRPCLHSLPMPTCAARLLAAPLAKSARDTSRGTCHNAYVQVRSHPVTMETFCQLGNPCNEERAPCRTETPASARLTPPHPYPTSPRQTRLPRPTRRSRPPTTEGP